MNKYICKDCNYNTNKLNNYTQHCNTSKHKKNITIKEPIVYICEYCSKEYNRQNSLRYHVQKCKILYDEILEEKTLEKYRDESIDKLVQEINELKHELASKVKHLDDKIDNVKPIFNLKSFLNEDCKNAISFNDLLLKLQYNFILDNTLTEDLSNALIKTLSEMDVYERPIHCVDVKRHKLNIKINDEWSTDINILYKLIKHVENSYHIYIMNWVDTNPDLFDNDDKIQLYAKYNLKFEKDINIPKIIRNISKILTIPKNN